MFPNSLSLVDLADITWEKIVSSRATRCIRSPLKITSGNAPGVSVIAWSAETFYADASLEPTFEAISTWVELDTSDLIPWQSADSQATPWQCWSLRGVQTSTFVASISSELFLDGLVSEYGPPPPIILRDWLRQASVPSKNFLLDRPLSCIAIAPDGLLCSIPDQFSERSKGPLVSDSLLIAQLDKFVELLASSGASTDTVGSEKRPYRLIETEPQSLREFLVTQGIDCPTTSSKVELQIDNSKTNVSATELFPKSDLLGRKNLTSSDFKQSVTPKRDSSSAHSRAPTARRMAPSIIALLLAAMGLGYMLLPSKSTQTADSTGSAESRVWSDSSGGPLTANTNSQSMDLPTSSETLKPDGNLSSVVASSDSTEASADLKLTEGTLTSEVSIAPTLNADLAAELSAKLMQGIAADIGSDSAIDPSRIESITSLLSPNASQGSSLEGSMAGTPIEIESNMKSETELKSLDAAFSDSGDNAPAPADLAPADPAAMSGESTSVDVPVASDEQSEISKAITIALKRPVQKEEFRIPFSVNPKVASVQVKWELPSDILITPEAPVLITGRQEQTWTIALKDESSKLAVTIKSKPSRKWLLGFVVKLRRDDGAEFPIALGDAKLMQQQLIARSKELMKQTQFLELVKGAKGGRAFASYYMPLAESSLKQTDLAIQQWIEIDDLVNKFYQSHKLNLTFQANTNGP